MQFFAYFDHNYFLISLALPVKQKKGTHPLPGAKHKNVFVQIIHLRLDVFRRNILGLISTSSLKRTEKRGPVRTIRQATWP